MQLALDASEFAIRSISPLFEMGAYEALWDQPAMSFKRMAEFFRGHEGAVPSDFVDEEEALRYSTEVLRLVKNAGIESFGVRVHGAGEYPFKLRDAQYPIELLYYQGWWDLADSPRSVAVVGTREPTDEGRARARKLVRHLVQDGYVVVSGLAKGIDTVAHQEALSNGGLTIAVIGTPITHSYPKENASLQREIAKNYLLISQVPIVRYSKQGPRGNRFFFPERNVTMSALTEATVIVEAGNTSGTLIQARAALAQGRKLFILDSCFRNSSLTWPEKFLARGAIRVTDYEDIRTHLAR